MSPKAWQAVLEVEALGRSWQLARPDNLDSLWDAMTDLDDDERIPYWTELWPSSHVLAQWLQLQQANITNQSCLDMGCGLGFTALVGSFLGAKVTAFDYEPDAIKYAKINAKHHDLHPEFLVMDWRNPALPCQFPYIWGGDVMYERRFVRPVLDFLQCTLAPGGKVWLAEPSRTIYDAFRLALSQNNWFGQCVYQGETKPLSQTLPVPIKIWELTRLPQLS